MEQQVTESSTSLEASENESARVLRRSPDQPWHVLQLATRRHRAENPQSGRLDPHHARGRGGMARPLNPDPHDTAQA